MSQKRRISGQNYFWVPFLQMTYVYIFEMCIKKGFLDAPFDLFKEKKFSPHRRVNVYFLWTKNLKYKKQPLNISQNVFI